ncbi:hypothetical protein HOLleu_03518 [Holothuria leucospilota]|uniref:Uncharacterized protein n=1 Tax=Holothuria leucospilota TaxID=206669 RepID=A0A9Q1CS31_HOLLE|nr:hypothetical protein HOLleu_03518 [Holothuria leucospilota]
MHAHATAGSNPPGLQTPLTGQGEGFKLQYVYVKVENEMVCTTSTMLECFQCLITAYYF